MTTGELYNSLGNSLLLIEKVCLAVGLGTDGAFGSYNGNVSCQLVDIRSHSQLSNEQKWCISKQTHSWLVHIQTNTFVCAKSFTRKALAIREKLCPLPSLLINIKSCY